MLHFIWNKIDNYYLINDISSKYNISYDTSKNIVNKLHNIYPPRRGEDITILNLQENKTDKCIPECNHKIYDINVRHSFWHFSYESYRNKHRIVV